MSDQKDIKYLIALSKINGLGPVSLKKLLDHFSDPEKILFASYQELLEVIGNQKITGAIVNQRKKINADAELEKINKHNVKILNYLDKNYPKLLKETYGFPPFFYYKGELIDFEKPLVAVVGSRKTSSEGIKVTEKIVQGLVRSSVGIVSGLAFGIDTIAHKTALENDGTTVAVLACGLDRVYPASNFNLAKQIIKKGMLISEHPIGTIPLKENFPRRNRLISGLSLGTLVTEAARKSGALITANYALEQNREVFTIPYNLDHKTGVGCNLLIQTGAKLVITVEDILEELGLNYFKVPRRKITFDDPKERLIYESLLNKNKHIEELLRELNLTSQKLSSTLAVMEVRGLVKRLDGGIYCIE